MTSAGRPYSDYLPGVHVLALDGREVMREPWVDRRKGLEDIGAALDPKRIGVVRVSVDANRLWSLWVGQ